MRQLFVQCSSELEADVASKVVEALRQALLAGMLGESWSVKAQRNAGGRVRVWLEGEANVTGAKSLIVARGAGDV